MKEVTQKSIISDISVLIVEDDFSYALEVEMIVHELGYQTLKTVSDSEKAIEVIRSEKPDLILMDVFIEGDKDGIGVAKQISDLNIPIIFITSHSSPDVYSQARGLSPFAFITKPFDKFTLQSTIESAITIFDNSFSKVEEQLNKEDHFFIKQNGRLDKVFLKNIHWIEANGNYCILNTNSRKYALKISLRKLKKRLPDDIFVQIHRGQIVQVDLIQNLNLSEGIVKLQNVELTLGPKYKSGLIKRLNLL